MAEDLFEIAKKQAPGLAHQVADQLRSAVTNALTGEVARMQKIAGEAERLRQDAAAEAATLSRARDQLRAEVASLRQEAGDLQAQRDELTAAVTALTTSKKELDDALSALRTRVGIPA